MGRIRVLRRRGSSLSEERNRKDQILRLRILIIRPFFKGEDLLRSLMVFMKINLCLSLYFEALEQ